MKLNNQSIISMKLTFFMIILSTALSAVHPSKIEDLQQLDINFENLAATKDEEKSSAAEWIR